MPRPVGGGFSWSIADTIGFGCAPSITAPANCMGFGCLILRRSDEYESRRQT